MAYKSLALATIAATLLATNVQGQECTGNAGFNTGKYRGSATVGFGDDVTSLGLGFTLGMPEWFGGAHVGTTSYGGGGGSSTNFGVDGGYQIMAPVLDEWHWCPVGSVSFSSADNTSGNVISLGGAIGSTFHESNPWQLIPSGSFSIVRSSYSYDAPGPFGGHFSDSEVYELVNLSLGFYRTSNKVTVMPWISLPVGLKGASSSFGATVSLGFGDMVR